MLLIALTKYQTYVLIMPVLTNVVPVAVLPIAEEILIW